MATTFSDYQDAEFLPPTLQNVLNKRSLKWIFVGGKGGVGKTTCSSTLAVLLSQIRRNVLIISTDPAHNLSDTYKQKFTNKPTLINGFANLYAMEIDPKFESEEKLFDGNADEQENEFVGMMRDLSTSFPGIDEVMGFAEMMVLVLSLEFETVVFDTAPTGHTLRLLSLPMEMDKTLHQFLGMKDKLSGILNHFSGLFGGQMPNMDSTKQVIHEVIKQFKDPKLTTFICVCIPEFLSLYETERLVQELNRLEIDVSNIIVNQVLYPEKDTHCGLCEARSKMQKKYIDQIKALYNDFHMIKIPLLKSEVRGVTGPDGLLEFGKFMIHPHNDTYNL